MTHSNRVLHRESAGGLPQFRQVYLLVRKMGRGTIIEGGDAVTSQKVIGFFTHLLRYDKRATVEVLRWSPISIVSGTGFE